MTNQNDAFKTAVAQMVNLGKDLLIQRISRHSKINQCEGYDKKSELEQLYINEITATAKVIRLFTGREISFQCERRRIHHPPEGNRLRVHETVSNLFDLQKFLIRRIRRI